MAAAAESTKNLGSTAHLSEDCPPILKSPTTRDILEDLGGYVIALWTVASVMVIVLLCLLLRTTIFVNKVAPKRWRRKIVWINAIYPFVCLMCLCSLIVPASSSLLNDVSIIFISNGVSKFVDLCLMYFGGESRVLLAVGQIELPLAVRPVCCCCRPCCPRPLLAKRHLKMMKMLVHQLPFTQCAYCLLLAYLFIANLTSPGQIAVNDAYIYLTVFNVVSCMSAMYGLAMFLQVTKGNLSHYHYTAKSVLMKLTLVFVKLQDIIFTITIHYGGVASTRHMSSKVYGTYIRDVVVLLEMFVFGLLAHRLYTHPEQYRHKPAATSKHPARRTAQLHSDSGSDCDSDSDSDDEAGTNTGAGSGTEYRKIEGVNSKPPRPQHTVKSSSYSDEGN